MKYRIKVIEKNNGEKEYIPQCLDKDKMFREIYISIIFLPVTIIYFLYNPIKLFTLTWWEYISVFHENKSDIQTYHTEDDFMCYKYRTQKEAQALIDIDKELYKKRIEKRDSEKLAKRMNKIKSISYLKY